MNRKEFQAKSIPDEELVKAIEIIQSLNVEGGTNRHNIIAHFAHLPAKIVTAKLRQGALKGIIVGCSSDTCARAGKNGCSSRYSLPEGVSA